eukprot:1136246-Rhodomonas_salina.1
MLVLFHFFSQLSYSFFVFVLDVLVDVWRKSRVRAHTLRPVVFFPANIKQPSALDNVRLTQECTAQVLLMPEDKVDTTYIMVATGTGIAPFRGTELTSCPKLYPGLRVQSQKKNEDVMVCSACFPPPFSLMLRLCTGFTHAPPLYRVPATPLRRGKPPQQRLQ